MNKERLVFDLADRVQTPNDGRELVSRAAEIVSLSPNYSIRRAFYFNLTNDGVMTPEEDREACLYSLLGYNLLLDFTWTLESMVFFEAIE